jgi:hypothetical protein
MLTLPRLAKLSPLLALVCCLGLRAGESKKDDWIKDFPVDKSELGPTGKNPYFILEPGHFLVLEDGKERVVITVLNETKKVDGVETRVVEVRETKGDKLVEVTRDFFAIHAKTKDVYKQYHRVGPEPAAAGPGRANPRAPCHPERQGQRQEEQGLKHE